ncbi:hypothetical protein V6N13_063582 [Hibiscus sabdariffa]
MNLMGVAVDSEEAAYNLYKDYGHRMGFSVRRGRNMYVSSTNVIRCKDYFCSKEGFKEFEGDINVKQHNKLETRNGCQAVIRFTMEDNIWTVTRFISEHNHELATPSKRHLLRSATSLLPAKANVISSMATTSLTEFILEFENLVARWRSSEGNLKVEEELTSLCGTKTFELREDKVIPSVIMPTSNISIPLYQNTMQFSNMGPGSNWYSDALNFPHRVVQQNNAATTQN